MGLSKSYLLSTQSRASLSHTVFDAILEVSSLATHAELVIGRASQSAGISHDSIDTANLGDSDVSLGVLHSSMHPSPGYSTYSTGISSLGHGISSQGQESS